MAYAWLKGIDKNGFDAIYCHDIDPARGQLFTSAFGAISVGLADAIKEAGIILLAVKPQVLAEVMQDSAGLWGSDKLLVSVLAGVKTQTLEAATGGKTPVIRVMPNTPCLVGQGVSALAAGKLATVEQLALVRALFAQVGLAVEIEEGLMDAVTAVSGSGPAYIFLVVEAMINAAVQVGLDAALARELVLGTCKGSLAMLETEKLQ